MVEIPATVLYNLYFTFATSAFGAVFFYFWKMRDTFPKKEIMKGGSPIAILTDAAGQIKLIKIKDIKGRSFHCKYGTYQLLEDCRYSCGKRDVFFYSLDFANPMSIESMAKIRDYLESSFAAPLSVKEVKQAALDDNLSHGIGSRGLAFLEKFYSIDIHAKSNVMYDAATKKNFRISKSHGLFAYLPQQSIGWREVAIVCINDRFLDIVPVKVIHDVENKEPRTLITNEKYGTFEVTDARTRYKKNKTNVYVITVRSMKEVSEPDQNEIQKEISE